jgi:hypothetical protein
MNTLAQSRSGLPQAWHAGGFKVEQAKADAIIQFAAKVRDWPLLEQAVDLKIEQQREFVRWWDDNVQPNNRPPLTVSGPETVSVDQAASLTSIGKVQVTRWRKKLSEEAKYRAQQILAACRKAGLEPDENHRAEGTGDNQWFTPEQYIEAAREVMGGIDLDPASHPIAQQIVRAARFLTPDDDGLKQEWHGRVWLNPPYSQPLIGQFIDKLIVEMAGGRVTEAILLTHNYTDTAWFHRAEKSAPRRAGKQTVIFLPGVIGAGKWLN